MKTHLLFFIILIWPCIIKSQTFTDSSLPIIIITTDTDPATGLPFEIPDTFKVLATMKVIYRPDSSRNYLTDQNNPEFLNYSGRIGIELRGNTSQSRLKKPYGLTTMQDDFSSDDNVSILGLPKENDWILNSLPFDESLIRNYLSYDLARNMGNYATRGVFCEVVLNGRYNGLYIFMEKIKVDENRVNIVKMSENDTVPPQLTGGYIAKADKVTEDEKVGWYMLSYNGKTGFLTENPDHKDIKAQQNQFLISQFLNLETAANAQNTSIVDGYPSIIDVPSFIDFMIVNELASNVDAYQFSTFFHKDRNGKLRAGPVWDFDLTYGNDMIMYGLNRGFYNVWQFADSTNTGARFWKDLFDNDTFKCQLTKRWKELNADSGLLSYSSISNRIDQLVTHISEAIPRENERWRTIRNHPLAIDTLKGWLQKRIEWLNLNLNSYSACSTVIAPPLVISKIHYYPLAMAELKHTDMEFIELSNNSMDTIDLTGIYFKELGITYQFPAYSKLAGGSKLFLASNTSAFQQAYGFSPFGEFTRNLSNKSEKLVLADAFGNVIDSVKYYDEAPWPVEANGMGYFLTLADLNSDNSLASSWTISNDITNGLKSLNIETSIRSYPNPAQTHITIDSEFHIIVSYEIFDLRGRKLVSNSDVNSSNFSVDLGRLQPNIYIIKLKNQEGRIIHLKVNKVP